MQIFAFGTTVAVTVLALAAPLSATPQADTTRPRVTFGGFVDAYYAFDAGRPSSIDRAFTTQAARHNEFNVNLAFVEAKLDGAKIRGRLALQAGTSVQSNYAAEPTVGTVSGPTLSRHIQEAVVGVRVAPALWLDGGIYLSHIGSESWISRDNLTYTRSLIAEFSPYYQSGVKATWQATSKLAAQLHVVNGWQIISENNDAKGLGARLDYAASDRLLLSAYNFIGDEEVADGAGGTVPRRRTFQGASVRFAPSARTVLLGTFDFGFQERAAGSGDADWYGAALIGRYEVSPAVAVAVRLERYQDDEQVLIATGTPDGFRATGVSINLDVRPRAELLWRTEVKGFTAEDPVFPDRSEPSGVADNNLLVVTSLGLTF